MNSRQKGAAGERELAKALRSHGFETRRGQQYCGSSQCGCFKDKSLVLELPFIAMVEQELTADCKFNRRSASKNGKIAVVYIDKSKSGLPLIDITNQFYNTDTAKERIKQLKELSNEQ